MPLSRAVRARRRDQANRAAPGGRPQPQARVPVTWISLSLNPGSERSDQGSATKSGIVRWVFF